MRILQYRPNAPHPARGTDGMGHMLDALMRGLAELGHTPFLYNEHPETDWSLLSFCTPSKLMSFPNYDILHMHSDWADIKRSEVYGKHYVRTLHWTIVRAETTQEMQGTQDYTTVGVSRYSMQYNGLDTNNVIYNPIYLTEAQKARIQENIAHKKEDYFLWVGGTDWYEQKGLDVAIDIIKRTGKTLKIVGGGQNEDIARHLRTISNHRIQYLGMIDDADAKYEVMSRAKGLLYPTRIPEACSMTILEALCCGCPILAYNHSSFPEFVRDGENGLLFGNGNWQSVARALVRYPSFDYSRIAEEAQDRYDYRRIAQQYLDYYNKVIDNSCKV